MRIPRCLLTAIALLVAASGVFGAPEVALPEHVRLLVPPAERPLPVVVWASGCSGFFHPRAPWHFVERSQHVISAGYAIAFVDYVAAAGLKSACAGELTIEQVGRHIVDAIRSLDGRRGLDLGRVVLLGSSLGGGGVLSVLSVEGIEHRAPAAVLSVYPACGGLREWTADVPVWVWYAGNDLIAPARACEPALSKVGGPVKAFTFPDAHHAFDLRGLPTELEPGQAAIAYNEAAAKELWRQIVAVLESLK